MSRKIFFVFSFLFFLAGTCLLAGLPWMVRAQRSYFARTEPYYASPVIAPGNALYVRKDRFGKGHFGSSRNGGRKHAGIDFVCRINDPIYAAKSGRVIRSEEEKGYGKYVYLLHPDGTVTRYAHLARLDARRGQWAGAGQVIGLCGKTGNAGNPRMIPHLHFEIRRHNQPVDPAHGCFNPDLSLNKYKS